MRQATPDNQGQAELQRLYTLFIEIFRGGFAGTLAGVLFLGVGARLAMRVSALLNPEARGSITDNENIVGEITLAGTFQLLVFIGIAGGLAVGAVWVAVRDWLPQHAFYRPLLAGLLTAATGSFAVVTARNEDFHLLDPPELHIALFILLVALTGTATAVFDRLLEAQMPASTTAGAILGGLIGFGLVFTLPLLFVLFFLNEDNKSPPWPAGLALIAVTIATIATWVRYYSKGDDASVEMPRWQRRLGVVAVVLFGFFGAVHLAVEVDAIL